MTKVSLNVKLLSHTIDPELTIALGGKLCYSKSEIDTLREDTKGNEDKFVGKLMSFGHLSPLEHASFTFGVQGVSRALLAQITRHRIASFSVQSQRYVTNDELTYIVPPSIAALGDEAVREFEAQMTTLHGFYSKWLEKGIPAEDARFVLPNAAETRMIFTMNVRELLHFFELRCCMRAQWEIRRLAWCMLAMVRREAPAIFNTKGTSCVSSVCSEGKMTCGRAREVCELDEQLTELVKNDASDEEIINWVNENIR
ncbi:MAG: FAD-dependent thymidylate synthase [Clostridia bacterium]|nr:FAD-dependent thymidylate synthase [Clostridia bacterium]